MEITTWRSLLRSSRSRPFLLRTLSKLRKWSGCDRLYKRRPNFSSQISGCRFPGSRLGGPNDLESTTATTITKTTASKALTTRTTSTTFVPHTTARTTAALIISTGLTDA